MLCSNVAATLLLLAAMFLASALAPSDVQSAEAIQPCTQSEKDKDRVDRCRLKAEINRLRKIQVGVEKEILAVPGVLGQCIGRSEAGLHFSVLVDRSGPKPELPTEIEGVPIRAQPRDAVQLLNGFPACGDTSPCHVAQQPLPVEMGNSGGSIDPAAAAGACSLGFKACDLGTGKVVFVSNSHCSQSVNCKLDPLGPNNSWIHPGRGDVTQNPSSCISSGTCSVIGDITRHAAPSCSSNNNFTDATKVESSSAQTSMSFRDIGFPQAGAGDPMPGDLVRKSSRTTGDTVGEITNVGCIIEVPESASSVFGFCCGALAMKDQIEWRPFDSVSVFKQGDSGSALLSLENEFEFQVVGLNWGGNGNFVYANHIDRVLAALNLSLNFVTCFQDCVFSAAVSTAEEDFEAEAGLLGLGHRFRDQILAESAVGRQFTQIYYQFSDEALGLAIRSPRLLKRTGRLLARFAPNLEELVANGRTTVTRADLDQVDRLLDDYAGYASGSMKAAIRTVRKQIVDPRVQKVLGVKVYP